MASLDSLEDFIREKAEKERWTHSRISAYLQQAYPGVRGLSVRSIQRFCSEKRIQKTARLTELELDEAVADAISQVGPSYGRKTMTGLLSSQGLRVGQRRVGESLQRTNPGYHHGRKTATARSINPIPYHADYFGHKLHVDQNEKLVMFGVTHMCAIDGYSGKVVGFITTPVKNNVEIYTHLFRPILLQYGMWDQVRVDQGKEWTLMLFVQEQLAHLRHNLSRAPHLQTTSKQNHCVERIWVEINGRVNYPIKTCLITLQERGEINLDCPHQKFCISWFSVHICNIGTTLAVQAWNAHPIPGPRRGVPNELMQRDNQAVQIEPRFVPEPSDAVEQFESLGGHLTLFSPFGDDPLKDRADLISQRETEYFAHYPDFGPIFHGVVNGDHNPFRCGLLFLIQLSKRLESQL